MPASTRSAKIAAPRTTGKTGLRPSAWDDGIAPLRRKPAGLASARRKFLRFFPQGFSDPKYLAWERGYKWTAHLEWENFLAGPMMAALLRDNQFEEIARRAIRIESHTNLLFSFEKMAIRDAVRTPRGARAFAEGLNRFLYGDDPAGARFDAWCRVLGELPRRQTRVLTWPVATVFGFLAQPRRHLFLKPMVTRTAAVRYGRAFEYVSRPSGAAYAHFVAFARAVKADLADLEPRDWIDVQSFLWVLGSSEYDD